MECGVRFVDFSPDGTKLVSGGFDGTIKVWDAGRPLRPSLLPSPLPLTPISDATGTLNEEKSVNVGSSVHHLHSVAISPDGTKIVSGLTKREISVDNLPFATIKVWDADTLEVVGEGVGVLTVVPSGPSLLPGRHEDPEQRVRGHDQSLDAGRPLRPTSPTVRCSDAMLTPAAGTLEQIGATISAAISQVLSVAFSPDGTKLVGGGSSGTIKVWSSGARGGVVVLADTALVDCTAEGGRGGGLFLDATSEARLDNVVAEACAADQGGGLFAADATFAIADSHVVNASASAGAAVYYDWVTSDSILNAPSRTATPGRARGGR